MTGSFLLQGHFSLLCCSLQLSASWNRSNFKCLVSTVSTADTVLMAWCFNTRIAGCDSAIAARCCVARITWIKFRKLLSALTTMHLSPIKCAARYTRPASILLCYMVADMGTVLLWLAVAPPQWPLHDPLDLWHQRLRRNTLGFATSEIWHWGYYSSPSQPASQMVQVPHPVSNLSQT